MGWWPGKLWTSNTVEVSASSKRRNSHTDHRWGLHEFERSQLNLHRLERSQHNLQSGLALLFHLRTVENCNNQPTGVEVCKQSNPIEVSKKWSVIEVLRTHSISCRQMYQHNYLQRWRLNTRTAPLWGEQQNQMWQSTNAGKEAVGVSLYSQSTAIYKLTMSPKQYMP